MIIKSIEEEILLWLTTTMFKSFPSSALKLQLSSACLDSSSRNSVQSVYRLSSSSFFLSGLKNTVRLERVRASRLNVEKCLSRSVITPVIESPLIMEYKTHCNNMVHSQRMGMIR